MNSPWKDFEIAVSNFLRAIDPRPEVEHNVKIPDRATKRPRQRDVWIEASLSGINIKILVSCKMYKRKITALDIEHFYGEFTRSGADKAVLYSASPFGANALVVAREMNISCCRLLRDEAPELPEMLTMHFYCSIPAFSCSIRNTGVSEDIATVGDLIDALKKDFPETESIARSAFTDIHSRILAQTKENMRCTEPVSATLSLRGSDDSPLIEIVLTHAWRNFVGCHDAVLANGSYSFENNKFVGEQSGPWIDVKNPPGDGWEALDGTIPEGKTTVRAAFQLCEDALYDRLRNTRIPALCLAKTSVTSENGQPDQLTDKS